MFYVLILGFRGGYLAELQSEDVFNDGKYYWAAYMSLDQSKVCLDGIQ